MRNFSAQKNEEMNYKILFEKILSNDIQFANRSQIGKRENGPKAFSCAPQKRKEKLWHIFSENGEIPEAFDVAFKNVTHGPGYERKRITQLNSSSLLALLCFWNVSKEHPITINNIEFTEVYFEVENTVFDHNSSVDILLVSEKESTWLYLESKFTEPLSPTNRLWLSYKYYDIYKNIRENLKINVFTPQKREHKEKEEFEITQNKKRYYGGIKQMVSHLIGVLKGASDKANAEYKEVYNNGLPKSIILGTILYDFSKYDVDDFKNLYSDYVSFYEDSFSLQNGKLIISTINDCLGGTNVYKKSSISVMPQVLTYQDVFGKQNPNFLMSNVAQFYTIY